jgi:hypothetical protein
MKENIKIERKKLCEKKMKWLKLMCILPRYIP